MYLQINTWKWENSFWKIFYFKTKDALVNHWIITKLTLLNKHKTKFVITTLFGTNSCIKALLRNKFFHMPHVPIPFNLTYPLIQKYPNDLYNLFWASTVISHAITKLGHKENRSTIKIPKLAIQAQYTPFHSKVHDS